VLIPAQCVSHRVVSGLI